MPCILQLLLAWYAPLTFLTLLVVFLVYFIAVKQFSVWLSKHCKCYFCRDNLLWMWASSPLMMIRDSVGKRVKFGM